MNTFRIGFSGAGGIARAHAYAMDALRYYYADFPHFEKVFVASPTAASREGFAERFGFSEAILPEAMWSREDIDTLFILGPNQTHTPQLLKALKRSAIRRIYVEKPIGASQQDLEALNALEPPPQKSIMVGFQFLQKSALRKALQIWKTGDFGRPIHFRAEYLHSSYLDPAYRQKRRSRLAPIPLGGAAADLGSHILSLLVAFLGPELKVEHAAASGSFADVDSKSDLCTTALLREPKSGAAGTFIASRVSLGSGDLLTLEIRGTKGAIKYTTDRPDVFETCHPNTGWQRHAVMSDYLPASKFPSGYLPGGWLRALVHAHYLFLDGEQHDEFVPDLAHGVHVQRLLQEMANQILAS